MNKFPFFGRGTGFPFRINALGGVVVTEGNDDAASVALQYLNENWTIREETGAKENHIAESVAHILLTQKTEHHTLPEFGSNLFQVVFEPNTNQFRLLAGHYFVQATRRWEKRATIEEDGVLFKLGDGLGVDRGEFPMICYIDFITSQVSGNLVQPFVTPRQAREQEYNTYGEDASGHDYYSRYNAVPIVFHDGVGYNRLQWRMTLPPAGDDVFYKVRELDSWLLISWKLYGDIRYWYMIASAYVHDLAKDGASRDLLDTVGNPVPNTILRAPSRSRALLLLT